MFQLIMDNPMRFVLALVLGVATAWWIWGRMAAQNAANEKAAEPAPQPAPQPEPEPAPVVPVAAAAAATTDDAEEPKPNIAAALGESDDLTRIKGIGPKLNDLCLSLGVRRFDQISGWSEADIAEVDQYLKIKGRISRDRWVDQAKFLAAGDDAGHKAEFG